VLLFKKGRHPALDAGSPAVVIGRRCQLVPLGDRGPAWRKWL